MSNFAFRQMALNFGFLLFRRIVLPWKRTPATWRAVIFNENGQVAVRCDDRGQDLPSADVISEGPILYECLTKLNLAKIDFSPRFPFRLIDITGRGGERMTMYFLGELLGANQGVAQEFVPGITYVERSSIESLIPDEIKEQLSGGRTRWLSEARKP